jgi:hypothetical protein
MGYRVIRGDSVGLVWTDAQLVLRSRIQLSKRSGWNFEDGGEEALEQLGITFNIG